MAAAPEASEGLGPRCPVCGQPGLLEFYDPRGVALCPRCGHLLRWFQGRLASLHGATDGIALATAFLDDLVLKQANDVWPRGSPSRAC